MPKVRHKYLLCTEDNFLYSFMELVYCFSCFSFVRKELPLSRHSIQHPSASFILTTTKRYIFHIKNEGIHFIDLGTMWRNWKLGSASPSTTLKLKNKVYTIELLTLKWGPTCMLQWIMHQSSWQCLWKLKGLPLVLESNTTRLTTKRKKEKKHWQSWEVRSESKHKML